MAEVLHRRSFVDGMILVESYIAREVYENEVLPWLQHEDQKGTVVPKRNSRRTRCRRVWFSDPDTAFAYKMKFG